MSTAEQVSTTTVERDASTSGTGDEGPQQQHLQRHNSTNNFNRSYSNNLQQQQQQHQQHQQQYHQQQQLLSSYIFRQDETSQIIGGNVCSPTQAHETSAFNHIVVILLAYAILHLIGLYVVNRNKSDIEREIKSYVRSKLALDNEDQKFSKLIETVIPRHLAGKLRDDILRPTNEIRNFNPMYLTSYDNVSILFADIVNFTKISSNCSAQLLVVTLNELFGRFDKAADRRECLRIKILGDCYYCVSGIPEQRHAKRRVAKQCVEMGLDMIDILDDLAQQGSNNSNSNSSNSNNNQGVQLSMRVGIHTGRVLCGVMGRKKWQYDVHSNDVTLANRTEQTGVPGRVHITADTLTALGDTFQVEPTSNWQRDEQLSKRSMRTYLIIAPPERRRDSANLVALAASSAPSGEPLATTHHAKDRFKRTTQRIMNALHFIRTIEVPFANLDCQTSMAVVKQMTLDTVKERGQIEDINELSLQFKEKQMGQLYMKLKGWWRLFVSCCLLIITLLALVSFLYSQTLAFGAAQAIDSPNNCRPQLVALKSQGSSRDNYQVTLNNLSPANSTVDYNSTIKSQSPSGEIGPTESSNGGHFIARLLAYLLVVLFLGTGLIYAHRIELLSRRNFIWHQIALRDREQMARVRDCNKKIFYNLIPEHVANHFLGRPNLANMDLYYRSYDLIGVMFVTVPDFSQFYQEVHINNHGLECLRLLNELICDFDSLLDDQRFRAIDKIKTIGSTYMAAIGLFPDHQLPLTQANDQSSAEEQQSLCGNNRQEVGQYVRTMIDFVHEMKRCLADINEHSYNNFSLRAGLNLGPVVAGVIGASKPQYDIWGNTVNVASRMESTCEPGRVQITEDVCSYLKGYKDLDLVCRGSIDVKGKGSMTTYYVQMSS